MKHNGEAIRLKKRRVGKNQKRENKRWEAWCGYSAKDTQSHRSKKRADLILSACCLFTFLLAADPAWQICVFAQVRLH